MDSLRVRAERWSRGGPLRQLREPVQGLLGGAWVCGVPELSANGTGGPASPGLVVLSGCVARCSLRKGVL